MRNEQEKFIDLNQFPKTKQGKIDWKNSIGIIVEFTYNNKIHTLKILEKISKNHMKIIIDDEIILEKAHINKIKKLTFEDLFYEPKYLYNVGDLINDVQIIKQIRIERKNKQGVCKIKAYLVKCLFDNYEFTVDETSLKANHSCPLYAGRIVIRGINDLATTNPEVIKYLADPNDAYIYTKSSGQKITVKCPICGFTKPMTVSELTKRGDMFCDVCADGVSYPNKFIREVICQISNQYNVFIPEYSPQWANLYRYDNYLELMDGTKLLIEMDGGFHYLNNKRFSSKSDEIKTQLAKDNNYELIRVDCNYNQVDDRYQHIKNNVISSLSQFLDFSKVDWDICNQKGKTSILVETLEFYKDNPKLGLDEIAEKCSISKETLYGYLHIGEQLGLCTYIRNDPSRIKNSKPIAMFDLDNNLIGIFKSAKVVEETFKECNFSHRSIRQSISKNIPYKNYIFKFVTYEEYQANKLIYVV